MILRSILLLGLVAGLAGCMSAPAPSPHEEAGAAFDELRDQIRHLIVEPEKRQRLTGFTDELETIMTQADEDRRSISRELKELNRNYDSTSEDFDRAFAVANAAREARQQRLLAILEETRALMTPEEWIALNRFKVLALEAALHVNAHPEIQP